MGVVSRDIRWHQISELLGSRMPSRCVAAGCSNAHRDGVSLYRFPKDPVLRAKWVKQVRRTRARWNPSDSSVLCNNHFTDDCFEPSYSIAAQLGMKRPRRLKPDVIPSVFKRPGVKTDDQETKKRSAVEKRERLRVRQ